MVLSSFKGKEIQNAWDKDKVEVENFYSHHYHTTEDKTVYLTLSESGSKSHTLICVPGKRAEMYMDTNGMIAYYPHAIDRYCERALGMEAKSDGQSIKWPVGKEQRIARFIFAAEREGIKILGTTKEVNPQTGICNRGVAVMGNALLMLKMDAANGIPIVDTYIDAERVNRFPHQKEAVRLAHQGRVDEALDAYNLYVEEKMECKKQKSA